MTTKPIYLNDQKIKQEGPYSVFTVTKDDYKKKVILKRITCHCQLQFKARSGIQNIGCQDIKDNIFNEGIYILRRRKRNEPIRIYSNYYKGVFVINKKKQACTFYHAHLDIN